MNATLFEYDDEWYEIAFQWTREAVDELKMAAGKGNYRYIPCKKRWLIRRHSVGAIVFGLQSIGYDVEGFKYIYIPQQGNAYDSIRSNDVDWESLFRKCPKEKRQGLYRSLSLAFHPDVSALNGDVMKAINNAYDTFR